MEKVVAFHFYTSLTQNCMAYKWKWARIYFALQHLLLAT